MRWAASVMVLAIACAGSSARAAVLEEFTVEDWSGLALSDDKTGRLASCAIYSKYQNGATLFFIKHADGNWTLSLVHDSWALTEESEQLLRFRVDREADAEIAGVALDTDQIGIALSDLDGLLGKVRAGSLLTFGFDGKEYGFDLSNSRKALDAAGECLERHRQAIGPQVAEQGDSQQQAPLQEGPAPAPGPEPMGADLPPDSAQASPVGARQAFGPWVVTATDDGAGKFVNCTAFGLYRDDQLIVSYRPDGTWEFGLYRAAWALDTNQTYYLWYNVDAPAEGAGVIKRPVEAVEPTRIFFEVSGDEDLITRMERGRRLNLQLRGLAAEPQLLTYLLQQTDLALAAVRECTRLNLEGPKQAEVAAAPVTDAPAAGEVEGAPAPLPALGSAVVETFEVPGWKAEAFADDSGAFTHCAIEAGYQNGTQLAFLRAAGGSLLMRLRRSDWSIPAGTWAPLEIELRRGQTSTQSTEGYALDETTLGVDLGAEPLGRDQLRASAELAVSIEDKTLSFDISDLDAGLAAIEACAARRLQGPDEMAVSPVPAVNPGPHGVTPEPELAAADAGALNIAPPMVNPDLLGITPGPAPAPVFDDPQPEGAASMSPAAALTRDLLARVGYHDAAILNREEAPAIMQAHDAMWRVGEVLGVTDILPERPIEQIKDELIRADAGRCPGMFESQDLDAGGGAQSAYIATFCEGQDQDTFGYYLLARRAEGDGYIHFALVSVGAGAAAKEISGKLYAAAKP